MWYGLKVTDTSSTFSLIVWQDSQGNRADVSSWRLLVRYDNSRWPGVETGKVSAASFSLCIPPSSKRLPSSCTHSIGYQAREDGDVRRAWEGCTNRWASITHTHARAL
jgi:hypothetical protein